MPTKQIRSVVFFFLLLSVVALAFALDFKLSAPVSLERLKVEQTSSGPIIHDLFGRFRSPMPIDCGICHCLPGSNKPGLCVDNVQPTTAECNTKGCNGTLLLPGSMCACVCSQQYPPACVDCNILGQCKSKLNGRSAKI